jgi:hypothetical protein
MSSSSNSFIVKNWQIVLWFIIAVFTAGGIFAEFTSLKNELTSVHNRLDKKVIVINEIEDRIFIIEKKARVRTRFIRSS